MRKLIIPIAFLSFMACGKKEWSRPYLVKKCNTEFSKRADIKQYFNDAQMGDLCDCVADKMMAKYKSQAEADKDQVGAEEIGSDCAKEVLQK